MKFTITSVNIERVNKGKGYNKAVVSYLYNGSPRQQNIMDFANPAVFAVVQTLTPNQEVDVTVIKNAAGFNEWSAISTDGVPSSGVPTPGPTGGTNKVVGSNYETREERASRQVLIVKQSSLSAAVASLTPGAKVALDPQEVIDRAQLFTDFVFSSGEVDSTDE